MITDETLLGGDDTPAAVHGYGPIPASVARGLVDKAVGDKRSRCTLRRLYRHPKAGQLVAMESRSRFFPQGLAMFIGLRDQTCRTPYCDAPIRHCDHARPHHRDGPTSAENGLGDCERCNYVKESPGWEVTAGTQNVVHTAEFVTPSGARYRSTAPPLLYSPHIDVTELEVEHRHRHRRTGRRLASRAGTRPVARSASCPGSSGSTPLGTTRPSSASCSRRPPAVDRRRAR